MRGRTLLHARNPEAIYYPQEHASHPYTRLTSQQIGAKLAAASRSPRIPALPWTPAMALSTDLTEGVCTSRTERLGTGRNRSGHVWIEDSKTPKGVAEIPLTEIAIEAFGHQLSIAGPGPYFRIYDLRST